MFVSIHHHHHVFFFILFMLYSSLSSTSGYLLLSFIFSWQILVAIAAAAAAAVVYVVVIIIIVVLISGILTSLPLFFLFCSIFRDYLLVLLLLLFIILLLLLLLPLLLYLLLFFSLYLLLLLLLLLLLPLLPLPSSSSSSTTQPSPSWPCLSWFSSHLHLAHHLPLGRLLVFHRILVPLLWLDKCLSIILNLDCKWTSPETIHQMDAEAGVNCSGFEITPPQKSQCLCISESLGIFESFFAVSEPNIAIWNLRFHQFGISFRDFSAICFAEPPAPSCMLAFGWSKRGGGGLKDLDSSRFLK